MKKDNINTIETFERIGVVLKIPHAKWNAEIPINYYSKGSTQVSREK